MKNDLKTFPRKATPQSYERWKKAFEQELREIERDGQLTMVEEDLVTHPDYPQTTFIENKDGKTIVYIDIKMILGEA